MVPGAACEVSPAGFAPGFAGVPRPGAGTLPSVFEDGASATIDEEGDGVLEGVVVALATAIEGADADGAAVGDDALASVVVVVGTAAAAAFAR